MHAQVLSQCNLEMLSQCNLEVLECTAVSVVQHQGTTLHYYLSLLHLATITAAWGRLHSILQQFRAEAQKIADKWFFLCPGMTFGWEFFLSFILVATVYACAIGAPNFGEQLAHLIVIVMLCHVWF